MTNIKEISVEEFCGGKDGLPHGACGLFAAAGDFKLGAVLKSARCLQYRGRTGAGITLKGLYKGNNFYVFHIMFRSQHKIKEFESIIESWGVHIIEEHDMIPKRYYYEYDLPIIKRYFVSPPSIEEMMYREKIKDDYEFILKNVSRFNKTFMEDARIFSSSKENGTFLTAFELHDTIKLYDILQYEDSYFEACLIHLRWPTSSGRGLWWGPQPISLGEISGIHNGHLSSDRSNAIALEQMGIHLHVGTDSEAIFREVDYLIRSGYSVEDIEWVIARRFPQEVAMMDEEKISRYERIMSNPFIRRMNISGPATAIVLVNDHIIGFTDRDHLRSFSVGYNDKVVFMSSEQRAILSAAYFMEEELDHVYDPDAGKVLGFKINGKNIEKL